MLDLHIKTAEDLAAEKQRAENARLVREAERYLTRTDWYVIRASEGGDPIPADILQRRQEARDTISELRSAPVNINADDAEALAARLPGVGAALAQAIIDGRPWADPADLSQIGGISAAMVQGWQVAPGLAV